MTYDCFYFAYGSNMNPDRLTKRKDVAPEAPHVLAVGKLKGYKPRFSHYSKTNKCGVLDIVEEKDFCVYGIIYGIKEEYLYLIDQAEGHPNVYCRILVEIEIEQIINDDFSKHISSNQKTLNCYSYEVVKKSPKQFPPSREYYKHIKIGHDQFGVNLKAIEDLISKVGLK